MGMSSSAPNTSAPITSDVIDFPTVERDPNAAELGASEVSARSNKSKRSASARSFIEQTKFGVVDPDEANDEFQIELAKKTPRTQRKVFREEEAKQVKKLGPLATCFTIFKGFVATGILYVPKDFKNGGWLFTPFTLLGSLFVTLYCAKLLL